MYMLLVFSDSDGVILLITEMVPYFLQDDVSYISFPTLRDAYMTFDVEIAFRSESTDG